MSTSRFGCALRHGIYFVNEFFHTIVHVLVFLFSCTYIIQVLANNVSVCCVCLGVLVRLVLYSSIRTRKNIVKVCCKVFTVFFFFWVCLPMFGVYGERSCEVKKNATSDFHLHVVKFI